MLIISHRNDIDGMGGVVLLKLACKDVDYILCEDYNINQIFMKEYLEGCLDKYDKIFITHAGIGDDHVKVVYDHILSKGLFENIYITRASCTISSHCGPGTLGILFMTE